MPEIVKVSWQLPFAAVQDWESWAMLHVDSVDQIVSLLQIRNRDRVTVFCKSQEDSVLYVPEHWVVCISNIAKLPYLLWIFCSHSSLFFFGKAVWFSVAKWLDYSLQVTDTLDYGF